MLPINWSETKFDATNYFSIKTWQKNFVTNIFLKLGNFFFAFDPVSSQRNVGCILIFSHFHFKIKSGKVEIIQFRKEKKTLKKTSVKSPSVCFTNYRKLTQLNMRKIYFLFHNMRMSQCDNSWRVYFRRQVSKSQKQQKNFIFVS